MRLLKKYYQEVEKMRLRRVHTQGEDAHLVLVDFRPSESAVSKEDREKFLEVVTLDPYLAFRDLAGSIINMGKVSVVAPDEAKNAVDLDEMLKIYLDNVFHDPNGMFVVVPDDIDEPVDKTEAKPVRWVYVPVDEIYIDPKKKNTYIEFDDMYMLVDPNEWVIYSDLSKKPIYSYRHGLGEFPAVRLGGRKVEDGYISFIEGAFMQAKLALRSLTDKERLAALAAHYITDVSEETCDADGCIDGKVMQDGHPVDCRSCGGTGMKAVSFPMGMTRIRKRSDTRLGESAEQEPFITYYQPPLDGLNVHIAEFDRKFAAYKESLNLVFSNNAASGASKLVDLNGQVATITGIAETIFGNIVKLLSFTYRIVDISGESDIDISISMPADFSVINAGSYQQNFNELKTNGAPMFLVAEAALSLSRATNRNNSYAEKSTRVMLRASSVAHLGMADLLLIKDAVDPIDLKVAVNGWGWLFEMSSRDMDTYMDTEEDVIVKMLRDRAAGVVVGNESAGAGGKAKEGLPIDSYT